jgi:hypothetical protein
MRVTEINWIDEDSKEASVVIAGPANKCTAFAHPCRLSTGDSVQYPLLSLGETNVMIVDSDEETIAKKQHLWSHRLIGIVKNVEQKIIDCGGILVTLTQLPGDAKIGDKVACYSTRLDVID